MSQTTIIMLNMRGSCATEGKKVHALFRVNNRIPSAQTTSDPDELAITAAGEQAGLADPGRAP